MSIGVALYLIVGFFLSGIYSASYKSDGREDAAIIAFGWFFLIFYMIGYSMVKKPLSEKESAG